MGREAGLGRNPQREMTARDVVDVLALLDDVGVDAWLDGGWAVDAALETQRRPHDDLDLVIELGDVDRLRSAFAGRGYLVARGEPPKSIELVDAEGRQIDVHPVVFTESGDGLYRMENDEDWEYPARGFAGRGRILDTVVRCLTPEVQMICHTGYAPHRNSFDDVWALSNRFGIPVPDAYRKDRASYLLRTE